MQNLFNELNAGTPEYVDNVLIKTHPPTSLSLRAARTIQTLTGSLETAHATTISLQRELDKSTEAFNSLKQSFDSLKEKYDTIGTISASRSASDAGIRENIGETSTVGSGDIAAGSSDTSDKGNDAN